MSSRVTEAEPAPSHKSSAWSVVTGANRGLGFVTAKHLLHAGHRVILACRHPDAGEKARQTLLSGNAQLADNVRAVSLDLADLKSIDAFARAVDAFGPLRLLVHNAGVLPRLRQQSRDGFELQFAVHVLGPFALTQMLLPALLRHQDSRVLFVTSKLYAQARPVLAHLAYRNRGYSAVKTYSETKLCQVLLMRPWAQLFSRGPIRVGAVHPGGFSTALARDFSWPIRAVWARWMKPIQACDSVASVAALERKAFGQGQYFVEQKPCSVNLRAQSDAMAQALWDLVTDCTQRALISSSLDDAGHRDAGERRRI